MIVENVFEKIIFPKLKNHVETNSIYNPLVTKKKPLESKKFPIVPVKLNPVKNFYNNLSYGEETYNFSIEIEIYATDKGSTSKRTVCNEVTEKIIDFFKTNYHVTVRTELDAHNIDSDVQRNKVRISGKLDTKYGLDNLIIYPR